MKKKEEGSGYVGIDTKGLYALVIEIEKEKYGFGWYYTTEKIESLREDMSSLKEGASHIVSCVLPLPKEFVIEEGKDRPNIGWRAVVVCRTTDNDEHGNKWKRLPIVLDEKHLNIFYSLCYSFEPKRIPVGPREDGKEEDPFSITL